MRPGTFKLRGKTAKDKLIHVEEVLRSLLRRNNARSVAMIPPMPFSLVVDRPDEVGTVMRYMFPADGTVVRASVFIEHMPLDDKKKPMREVPIFIKIFGSTRTMTHEILVKRFPTSVDLDYPVSTGTRMEVSFASNLDVSGIWIGMLYRISPSFNEVKRVLTTDLERELEDA